MDDGVISQKYGLLIVVPTVLILRNSYAKAEAKCVTNCRHIWARMIIGFAGLRQTKKSNI